MNQPSLFPEPRRNAGLFSQYYLDEVLLSSLAEFAENKYDLGDEYFRTKFAELAPIIKANEELALTRNESQLEESVIRPILKQVLGHLYEVQVAYKGDRLDYLLFPSDENLRVARKLKAGTKEYEKLSSGIVETKAWKPSTKPEKLDEANISQIYRYLINFNKRWGVLTNGFRWILFANKPGIRQDQYIEFDLTEVIRGGELSPNFKLFIFLFRRQAFEIVSGTDATLDKVLDESFSKAAKLQSNLKAKVYEAFKIVAEEYRSFNKLKLESEGEIAELKETSLVFLYRILFLLYGESRLILPVRPESEAYYQYSLERLLVEWMDDRTFKRANTYSVRYWSWLNDLFGLIHGLEHDGSRSRLGEDIGLPAYDGGLFDPDQYTKLEKWKLGDKAIKDVMDKLAFTGEKSKANEAKRVRVSYRDLGVQHLGNIYEGILENKLVLEDGKIAVIADNGERHATGSYYTPDYIVDYIVNETLLPIVKEALAAIKPVKKRLPEAEVEEAILRIKVLDPAMGSGHFLIGVIDFLAEQLVKKGDDNAVYTEAELQECRRRVGERCVYGVDLNPMAVELAKLSIWLHTLSQSKPLTFLDNHIKWGNSLIGARIEDLQVLPDVKKKRNAENITGQENTLFPNSLLEQEVKIWLGDGAVFRLPSDTIETVKEKETAEKVLETHRLKYRHLADLWTSLYFQNVPLTDASILFRKLKDAIIVNAEEAPLPVSPILDEALRLKEEKRFFHWELEFPEIFFDEFGRLKTEDGGFDAVIGNPPYGARLREDEKKALCQFYPETGFGNIDSYKFFTQKSLILGKYIASGSFILSDSFLEKEYFSDLRQLIVKNSSWVRSVRLGDYVFEEVQLPTALLLFKKQNDAAKAFEYFNVGNLPSNAAKEIALNLPIAFNTIAPEYEKGLIPHSTLSSKAKTHKLIELYDEVMGVKVYQRGKGKPRQSDDERLENRFISNVAKEGWLPFLSEGIYRYDQHWNGEFIYYGEWLAEPREIRYFDCPKVVLREIVNPRPFATLVQDPTVVKNTAAVFVNRENRYSLHYLLGLLNSNFFKSLIFERASKRDNKTYPSFTSHLLKELPIIEILFTTPKKEREKLTNKLISESELAISSNETEEQIKQKLQPTIVLAQQLSEEKNDVLHDFLSHLAEEMLAMNKEKQTLAEDFFMWTENYNIPPRSTLKPKTFLDEFWKKEFKHILAHLKRNKVPPLGRQGEDSLLERFNSSSAALLQLEKQITLTDWLIDQVVYALYELTKEEIAVVERS